MLTSLIFERKTFRNLSKERRCTGRDNNNEKFFMHINFKQSSNIYNKELKIFIQI